MADKEEPETTPETGKSDPWEKLSGVIDAAFERNFTAWQEKQTSSESPVSDPEPEKETPKKQERKKGFLSDFFKGLDLSE